MDDILKKEIEQFESEKKQEASKNLSSFISGNTIVGDLLSLNYNEAVVLVHDSLRQKVGGLPMGCFLLASRIKLEGSTDVDVEHEDTALIFLRVIGNASLANHSYTERYRLDAGFRAIDTPEEWDSPEKTDAFTLNELRHAGVRCSVLGTFRMKEHGELWKLTFGADISNFYSGQGMKVYKPMEESLRQIVNYTKPTGNTHNLAGRPVLIGHVRYSSSETKESEKIHVPIGIEPTDLLARRTALFGMSRSGKSNTIKVIAFSVFKLREKDKKKGRIGQLIFDANGEYCNKTLQDKWCLREVGSKTKNALKEDVVTYGLYPHPDDLGRQMLRINFMGNDIEDWTDRKKVIDAMASLVAGKDHIDSELEGTETLFVKTFIDTPLDVPSEIKKEWDGSAQTRYHRSILVYRSILAAAGFDTEQDNVRIKGLFGQDLLKKFTDAGYADSANTLGEPLVSWGDLQVALTALKKFIDTVLDDKKGGDTSKFVRKWADDTLIGVLSLYKRVTGPQRLRDLKKHHSIESRKDYSDKIVDEVRDGKMVIVDSSVGPKKSIKHISDRIMHAVFKAQVGDFVEPKFEEGSMASPPDIVIYIEEAHNLLPKKEDLTNIWARTAKEGSKFHIGMVYSTQEPSSIMSNILKNTDNWFVAHLNNKDEIKELGKYYDFEEFVDQILKVPDTGFLRMRCLSNPYIVPVQVAEFKAPESEEE